MSLEIYEVIEKALVGWDFDLPSDMGKKLWKMIIESYGDDEDDATKVEGWLMSGGAEAKVGKSADGHIYSGKHCLSENL